MKHSLVGFMFLFCKSPGWNHRNSFEKTLFSRKYFVWNWNIWNLYTFIKVPVWIIRNHVKHTFRPKIFGLKLEYLNYKSPGWNHRKLRERHFSAENIWFEFRILEIGIFHIHVVALARAHPPIPYIPPFLDIDENVAIYATCTQHVL